MNPKTKYENLVHAFYGKGFLVKDQEGLTKICEHIFVTNGWPKLQPSQVMINTLITI